MIAFPKAKINLGLRITGKRSDGFHDIETLFYPVNLCDALEMVVNTGRSGRDILTLSGYRLHKNPENNLVLKAVEKLRETVPFPCLKIHLHKNIPVGSGLGGGSSDAACTLRTIRRIFDLSLNNDELKKIASALGSDCSFFVDEKPAFAYGKGELLEPSGYLLEGLYIVLLNPGISISTREAYENCIPARPEKSLQDLLKNPINKWKDLITNDFERLIFEKYPRIRTIKHDLYDSGAVYSSMSGSGSSVYGIFTEKPDIGTNLRKLVIFEGSL